MKFLLMILQLYRARKCAENIQNFTLWQKEEAAMKRSINTIPRDEYYELLSEAASRMRKKIRDLIFEEDSKQLACENREEYEKAEKHDFNARALLIAMDAITKSPNQFKKGSKR